MRNKEEPGFRFAPPVSAHLENRVHDRREAKERIEEDKLVATVILHDLADDERRRHDPGFCDVEAHSDPVTPRTLRGRAS